MQNFASAGKANTAPPNVKNVSHKARTTAVSSSTSRSAHPPSLVSSVLQLVSDIATVRPCIYEMASSVAGGLGACSKW